MPVELLPTHPAKLAIDDAIDHYFTNLTDGDKKEKEITFLADLITQIEPWLMYTGDSLENIYKLIEDTPEKTNLIYTLTMLFYQRYIPDEQYIYNLANAAAVGSYRTAKMSFMPMEYHDRIPSMSAVIDFLNNNRSLVMIATVISYFETSILAANLGAS